MHKPPFFTTFPYVTLRTAKYTLEGSNPAINVGYTGHPVLSHLDNPVFGHILTLTDQAVLLLNPDTAAYEHVSDNISTLCGRPAAEFLAAGEELFLDLIHGDDLRYLRQVVFPDGARCRRNLPPSRWRDLKFSHTCRLRNGDGSFTHVLHESIPLSVEKGKVLLALSIITDISPFKKDNAVVYKNVLLEGTRGPKTLSQGLCRDSLFSVRETEVLALTARGYSEKQIADRLSLSLYTVKSHRKKMLRKAGVRNAPALVRFGIANLLI